MSVMRMSQRKEWARVDMLTAMCLLGRTYNIPVCLWLLDTHPYNPPMIYVKPTASMQIKPGRHVDMSGRIYLPYLHEWKHVSVLLMINVLCSLYCALSVACLCITSPLACYYSPRKLILILSSHGG